MKGSIILTTIHEIDALLQSYFDNFQMYGRLEQVEVFVIPDRKTPRSVYESCRLLRNQGLRIHCPSLDEQEAFLRKIGIPPYFIPFDSDNRRNVGYLMALEGGADFIISIDDDNFAIIDQDFWAAHCVVCSDEVVAEVLSSSSGWFNPCTLLTFDHSLPLYPRGFPHYARCSDPALTQSERRVPVHVNVGLWIGDPDIDAMTWLVLPSRSLEFKGQPVVLDLDTWSPINSQNTALRREAIAAYYFVKMGYQLLNMPYIDRYGDIFSGYFLQKCVKHVGGYCRIGNPIVEHRRNTHDYLRDAAQELSGMMMIEELLPALMEIKLEGDSYCEAYVGLSYALEDLIETFKGLIWTDAAKGYFHQVGHHMRVWAKAVARLLGGENI